MVIYLSFMQAVLAGSRWSLSVAVVGAVLLVRGARMCVLVSGPHLVIRNVLRASRVPLAAVAYAEWAEPPLPFFPVPLVFMLRSGERRRAAGVSKWSSMWALGNADQREVRLLLANLGIDLREHPGKGG
jgi:hypothetical protein